MAVINNQEKNYTGFPYFSNIHPNVRKQLENRKGKQFTDKIAWISALSGVQINNKGLKSLTNSSTNIYQKSSLFQPPPGIISLNIKYLTEYGGVREATLNWKVYNLIQLEEWAPYFLIPGHYILLEWGWGNTNIYHDKKHLWTLVNNSDKSYLEFYKRSMLHNGNYDGMLGVMVDYSINNGENGGYELTTKIANKGSLMYGINLTNQIVDIGDKKINIGKNEIKKYVEEDLDRDISTGKYGYDNIYIDTGHATRLSGQFGTISTGYNYTFVTWGYFEDHIITDHIGIKNFIMKSIDNDGNSILIANNPKLLTTNLDVCIIPQNIPSSKSGLDPINLFPATNIGRGNDSGYIRNIYINVNLIKDVILNSDTLVDAITSLLDHINAACVEFWKFKLKVNETNNYLQVIDEMYIPEKVKNKSGNNKQTYVFNLYGGNSIIKEFSFNSNLPSDYKSAIYWSSIKHPDDDSVLNLNDDTFTNFWNNKKSSDYFVNNVKLSIVSTYKQPIKESNKKNKTDKISHDIKINENNEKYSLYLKENFLPKIDEEGFYDIDTKLRHDILLGGKNKDNALLPITLDIILNGISGLRIADIFNVDFLPNNYQKFGIFQIKGIEHNISDNFWTTTITSGLRVSGV